MNWEEILSSVEKPSRYLGGEANVPQKDPRGIRLRFALAFPDTYEVGMSHLGLQILYAVLNDLPRVSAERVYAPWPDMEQRLREHGIPLSSLESHLPLKDFDIVGFSFQYELSYTNVLNMLDLGGIPIRSKDRGPDDPLVIAGGPSAFNPVPMASFIDAFVIGEGEEAVVEIAAAVVAEKEKTKRREGLLEALAAIPGVYVPALHNPGAVTVRKRVVADLNRWTLPCRPVVPLMKTIHDRISLEIARGCTRGCRFCQAGMVWRPLRERRTDVLERMADGMVNATGYEEISLLSLSSGDFNGIGTLLSTLMDRYYERRIALALPSLRVETLKKELMDAIRRVRKTSFTLAPEAGTQRLRDAINKGNTEQDLLSTAGTVFAAGWRNLKLYFMLGLPTETEADLEGIADLAYKVLGETRNRGQITISLSTFVPKPHTPFQWQRQIGIEETLARQEFFKRRIRHRNLSVKWHDARMSLLEGVLSRGDERAGSLVEQAFRLGCRFDGWSERFRFEWWEEALRKTGLSVDRSLDSRSADDELPWDFVDTGVRKAYLAGEAGKALDGLMTEDCRFGACGDCGACDGREIRIVTNPRETTGPSASGAAELPAGVGSPAQRFEIRFSKRGRARFLSHLEAATALFRAFNRAGIALAYSQGFHPHPKISFACATAVGVESDGEFAEVQLHGSRVEAGEIPARVNPCLPQGLAIEAAEKLPPDGPSRFARIAGFDFQIALPLDLPDASLPSLEDRIAGFLAAGRCEIVREGGGKTSVRDIRPLVERLTLNREEKRIDMTVRFSPAGTVRPADVLSQVLGVAPSDLPRYRIRKTGTFR
ncbi:MAG TPA: TIGR03960 family B12-binding radical SAM protein [Syntrophales bacterium]|nr:TIGR03960 family B12-binding radical SAM protein [Syntrophales bacterium]